MAGVQGGGLIGLGVVLLLTLFVGTTRADLPIHCLNRQVRGEWIFTLSSNDDSSLSCGYESPDRNRQHFTTYNYKLHGNITTMEVTLLEPNIAISGRHKGVWTMIYDEGFEVKVAGKELFAFSKYAPIDGRATSDEISDYISYCDETMIGWYHGDNNKGYGCWHGRKKQSSILDTNSDNAKLGKREYVVSPTTSMMEIGSSVAMFEPDYAFVETNNKDMSSTWQAAVHEQFLGKSMKEMMRLLGTRRFHKKGRHARARSFTDTDSISDSNNVVMLEGETTIVERGVYKKVHHHHHHHRHNKTKKLGPGAIPPFLESGKWLNEKTNKWEELPRSWDWRAADLGEGAGVQNYDSPARNQGSCGSCYAVAAALVMESRIRIATRLKEQVLLSPQHVLSCSYHNQGCEGGYPFLVAKFGEEVGLVEESCWPYDGADTPCGDGTKCRDNETPITKRYFLKNHRYIGGFYGACKEEHMMREIRAHGPVMVAFEAPSSLFYYKSGVFTGPRPRSEEQGPNGMVNPWQQTNHAVVAIGWGEELQDNGEVMKYWIIKNTWGQDWGENGFFRIRRGKDECAIESMAVAAEVVIA